MPGFIKGMQAKHVSQLYGAEKELPTDEELMKTLKEVRRETLKLEAQILKIDGLMEDVKGNIEHQKDYVKYLLELEKLRSAKDRMIENTYSLVEAMSKNDRKKTRRR